MSFYTTFIDEKTLVTILKIIPLNKDLQELIIYEIINDIIREDFSIHDYEDVVDIDDDNYYSDYYDIFE